MWVGETCKWMLSTEAGVRDCRRYSSARNRSLSSCHLSSENKSCATVGYAVALTRRREGQRHLIAAPTALLRSSFAASGAASCRPFHRLLSQNFSNRQHQVSTAGDVAPMIFAGRPDLQLDAVGQSGCQTFWGSEWELVAQQIDRPWVFSRALYLILGAGGGGGENEGGEGTLVLLLAGFRPVRQVSSGILDGAPRVPHPHQLHKLLPQPQQRQQSSTSLPFKE